MMAAMFDVSVKIGWRLSFLYNFSNISISCISLINKFKLIKDFKPVSTSLFINKKNLIIIEFFKLCSFIYQIINESNTSISQVEINKSIQVFIFSALKK